MSSSVKCSTCRFWQPVDDEDGEPLGDCRRFPPSYEGWPRTYEADWCGEWNEALSLH